MTTNLKDKAVKIKGKDYVLVKDRIQAFNEKYPNGSIQTELLSDTESNRIVVRATVYTDNTSHTEKDGVIQYVERQVFTGHAQENVGEGHINKTSALENAETSAVGRALAMMGIGIIDSIASADEMKKAGLSDDVPF